MCSQRTERLHWTQRKNCLCAFTLPMTIPLFEKRETPLWLNLSPDQKLWPTRNKKTFEKNWKTSQAWGFVFFFSFTCFFDGSLELALALLALMAAWNSQLQHCPQIILASFQINFPQMYLSRHWLGRCLNSFVKWQWRLCNHSKFRDAKNCFQSQKKNTSNSLMLKKSQPISNWQSAFFFKI